MAASNLGLSTVRALAVVAVFGAFGCSDEDSPAPRGSAGALPAGAFTGGAGEGSRTGGSAGASGAEGGMAGSRLTGGGGGTAGSTGGVAGSSAAGVESSGGLAGSSGGLGGSSGGLPGSGGTAISDGGTSPSGGEGGSSGDATGASGGMAGSSATGSEGGFAGSAEGGAGAGSMGGSGGAGSGGEGGAVIGAGGFGGLAGSESTGGGPVGGSAGATGEVISSYEFETEELDGWIVVGHALESQAVLEPSSGLPPPAAGISALMAPDTTATFSLFLTTPEDLSGATLRVPLRVVAADGPVWFLVFDLSGPAETWGTTPATGISPSSEWSVLEFVFDALSHDPTQVTRFGIQFGPESWTADGALAFEVDRVTITR